MLQRPIILPRFPRWRLKQMASLALGLTLITVAGCSSSTLVDRPDGSTPPDTGTGDARDGHASQCHSRTTDHASISIEVADGGTLSCASAATDVGIAAPPPTVFRGQIVSAESGAVVLDHCEVGQPCVPSGLRVVVAAAGIDLRSMPHVWAQVRFQQDSFRGCHQAVEVTTADPTDGSPAQDAAGQLLLAASEGREPIEEAPYQMTRVRLGCSSETGCGAIAPDDYFFEVTADGSVPPTSVYMGQTVDWQGVGRQFAVRNLRSFQTAACDDYWNFAYYIVVK